MTSAKVAISLPEEVLHQARYAVRRGRASSLSAYVSVAIQEKAKSDDLEELLDEMLAESGGPLTAAESRAADLALGLKKRRRRGR